jgi:hypothetical protein
MAVAASPETAATARRSGNVTAALCGGNVGASPIDSGGTVTRCDARSDSVSGAPGSVLPLAESFGFTQ